MKKMLLKFADNLLSKNQMKSIVGGTYYITCKDANGGILGYTQGTGCGANYTMNLCKGAHGTTGQTACYNG